ncbi:MAG: GNAT family N-acetyltransferase [Bacteroidales bacterium]|nr:GNAT family N-acetyltransferase [Bacteroidales bacterium]
MIIREIHEKDASEFLIFLQQLDEESKFLLYEAGERAESTSGIESYIRKIYASSSFLIIAEEDNKIVGFLSAERGIANRIKHCAYIVTGILKKQQGKGIGTLFFEKLDEWATKSHIHRLELTVMTHNNIAIHLYEKSGYQIEGIKKSAMKVDGNHIDEYYMYKLI